MAVNIYALPQPYLEISLKAWWTLDVWQEYFFIWYYNAWYWYYGNAVWQVSEEISIIPTTWYQTIEIINWSRRSNILSVADLWWWQCRITCESTVWLVSNMKIKGTTWYDWTHINPTNITDTTYDITATFVWTSTGMWLYDSGRPNDVPQRSNWIIYKWDKYSMMRPDWSYYQWLNLNDPYWNTFSGWNEFHTGWIARYWHRKWSTRYYAQWLNADTITFSKEETTSWYNKLFDWLVVWTTISWYMRHHTIAYNPITRPAYNWFNLEKGRLLIVADTADCSRDDLIDALQASWHDDMFILMNDYTYYSNIKGMLLNAHFQYWWGSFLFKDFNLTLLWWSFDHGLGSGTFRFERCYITDIPTQKSSWITEWATYTDSIRNHIWNAFIMDKIASSNSNFTGSMTFYNKSISWFNLIWWYPWASAYFQWRYQRQNNTSVIRDFYIKAYYILFTQNWLWNNTWIMEKVEFVNKDYFTYDTNVVWGNTDWDCDFVMECKNVKSDRNNWQIVVRSGSLNYSRDIKDIWNMRYWINLTILDVDWTPIENANAKIEWDWSSLHWDERLKNNSFEDWSTDWNIYGNTTFSGWDVVFTWTSDLYQNAYMTPNLSYRAVVNIKETNWWYIYFYMDWVYTEIPSTVWEHIIDFVYTNGYFYIWSNSDFTGKISEVSIKQDYKTKATTDVDWKCEVVWLSYTAHIDSADWTGARYYENSDYKPMKLTISKDWYETYSVDWLIIKEWKDRTIKATKANKFMLDIDWNVNALTKPWSWTKSQLVKF